MSPKRPKQQIMQLLTPRPPPKHSAEAPAAVETAAVAPAAARLPTTASAPDTMPATAAPQKGNRVFASPLARRIAADAGLDIASVTGTGPHGRIIRADVEEALATGIASPTMAVSASGAAVSAQSERFEPHRIQRCAGSSQNVCNIPSKMPRISI